MATLTTNYGLTKDEGTDYYNIQTQNDNLDIIDAEIKLAKEKAEQAFQSASNGKASIKNAITGVDPSVVIPTNATFQQLANAIGQIETGEDTTDATAVEGDVLATKTYYANGKKTGTMVNNGPAVSEIVNLTSHNQEYTIPKGYHSGLRKIKAVITGLVASVIKAGVTVGGVLGSFTSDGNVVAADMLSGKRGYSNGLPVDGSMANRGAVNQSLAVNGTYTIPEGYHNGFGKVTQAITTKGAATITPGTTDQTIASGQYLSGAQIIKGDVNLVPANILNGRTIFGVAGALAQGRKFATGSSTAPSGTETARGSDGTSLGDFRFISASGLTFKPSVIIGYKTAGTGNPSCFIYTSFVDGLNGQAETCKTFQYSNNATSTSSNYNHAVNRASSPAQVTSTLFKLPASGANHNDTYTWYAFE